MNKNLNRRRRAVMMIAGLLLAFAGSLTTIDASPAEATPWNPTVTLQGRAMIGACRPNWVWVESSNGERGWATQPGGNYRFTFRKAPTSTMIVTVKAGCGSTQRVTRFGVNRPAVGTTATRNVIWAY